MLHIKNREYHYRKVFKFQIVNVAYDFVDPQRVIPIRGQAKLSALLLRRRAPPKLRHRPGNLRQLRIDQHPLEVLEAVVVEIDEVCEGSVGQALGPPRLEVATHFSEDLRVDKAGDKVAEAFLCEVAGVVDGPGLDQPPEGLCDADDVVDVVEVGADVLDVYVGAVALF